MGHGLLVLEAMRSIVRDAQARLLTMRDYGAAMRFDLVDLQLFIAVAETRSITRGAQRVHLALASASERIKGLEASLGVGC